MSSHMERETNYDKLFEYVGSEKFKDEQVRLYRHVEAYDAHYLINLTFHFLEFYFRYCDDNDVRSLIPLEWDNKTMKIIIDTFYDKFGYDEGIFYKILFPAVLNIYLETSDLAKEISRKCDFEYTEIEDKLLEEELRAAGRLSMDFKLTDKRYWNKRAKFNRKKENKK